jgi:predicted transcriptional regulator
MLSYKDAPYSLENGYLNWVFRLTGAGYAVFPIKGKIPYPGSHGHKDATTDYKVFRNLLNVHNNCEPSNIAVATGQVSQLTALDIDSEEALQKLQSVGLCKLEPPNIVQKSGRKEGGYHFFYRYIPQLKTTTNALVKVDVRNDNSSITIMPSVHSSGNPYKIIVGDEAFLNRQLPPMPKQLLALLLPRASFSSKKKEPGAYSRFTIGDIEVGERNSAFTSLAGFLYKNLRGENDLIEFMVSQCNEQLQYPLKRDELDRILESVRKYHEELDF